MTETKKHRPLKDEVAAREEKPPAGAEAPAAPPAAADPARGLAPLPEGTPAPPSAEEVLRKERDDLRDQLLRKRADFENFRKRVERDREQATQEARAALLRELIPTLDNLERALAAGGEDASLRTGVELTLRELTTLLERHGVTAHDPTGQHFDPEVHQALLHESAPGYDEGTVVAVFRKGYSLGERLLRPALVKVAKGGEPGRGSDSGGVH